MENIFLRLKFFKSHIVLVLLKSSNQFLTFWPRNEPMTLLANCIQQEFEICCPKGKSTCHMRLLSYEPQSACGVWHLQVFPHNQLDTHEPLEHLLFLLIYSQIRHFTSVFIFRRRKIETKDTYNQFTSTFIDLYHRVECCESRLMERKVGGPAVKSLPWMEDT